jgi:putative PIN family toxin of toxin-antitoxin system
LRVVLDTNILVSALLNARGAPARVVGGFRAGRFTVVTSEPLLTELADVLSRPRIARRGVTPEKAGEMLSLLRASAMIVSVEGNIHVCRDPKDDVVIETAITGNAAAVVTGDADLAEAPEVVAYLSTHPIIVLPVSAFAQLLPSLPPHPLLELPPDLDIQP